MVDVYDKSSRAAQVACVVRNGYLAVKSYMTCRNTHQSESDPYPDIPGSSFLGLSDD